MRAAGTGLYEEISCSLVLCSIGYRNVNIDEDIPFDEKEGIIPNTNGRVKDGNGNIIRGKVMSL